MLESCVKNCGRRFQLLVANKEFVHELVKMIGPKNDPPSVVQEKVLSLIQSWADAFKSNPEMAGVSQVYNDLKQKGIEFPMTDLDTLAPIHTPQRVTILLFPILKYFPVSFSFKFCWLILVFTIECARHVALSTDQRTNKTAAPKREPN